MPIAVDVELLVTPIVRALREDRRHDAAALLRALGRAHWDRTEWPYDSAADDPQNHARWCTRGTAPDAEQLSELADAYERFDWS